MRPVAECRFGAMGTTAHVLVVGPNAPELLARARARIDELEQRWSRFLPSSDVSAMNRADGADVEVAHDTLTLVEHGVAAWRLTEGRFDPTMAFQIAAMGYDRPFDEVRELSGRGESGAGRPFRAAAGCAEIVVDRVASQVNLPPNVGFDPGGLGKGLAADIVTRELIEENAWGVMVNLGGDLTVRGLPPKGVEWAVAIHEPAIRDEPITTIRLQDASLATSTTAKRQWTFDDLEHHHILDPSTGRSARARPVLAAVVAGQAWWAEAAATSMLVDDRDVHDEGCLVVMADGRVERRRDFDRFES